ncbi:MAG TPA: M67 family metallopeptidase [Candidatus Acidoferrales bacterium]|nr:M67 family metallopeptidase [Candidatus Acidoferrales bacterium]
MHHIVHVPDSILRKILVQAKHAHGIECCGFLAGRDGVITHAFPAANASPNPATSFEIAPREILDRIRAMRAAGIELLGIYHSHPNSPNEPSPSDIAQAYYPDAAYFILSPLPDTPHPVRAFSIRDGRVTELAIEAV